MDIEILKDLYLNKDFNCAESTLMVLNQEYGLGLDADAYKLIGAFGGGMCCGKTCGALCACIAALGMLKIKERAHATADLKEICAEYVSRFEKEFGSTDCVAIKQKMFADGIRCFRTVERNAQMFEQYLKEIK